MKKKMKSCKVCLTLQKDQQMEPHLFLKFHYGDSTDFQERKKSQGITQHFVIRSQNIQ